MKTFPLIKLFLSVALFSGCAPSKKSSSEKEVIESSYKVIMHESFESSNDAALLIGSVFNNETTKPINNAGVQIKEIKKGSFTDTIGRFSFEVPRGVYKIEAYHVGNTTIITKPIELEANTKTEIIFYLGTTKEY